MKRLLALLAFLCAAAFSLPAAADHLDGVLPLHKDDLAAVAAAKSRPDRHVMLYFGDHLN
ncbi:MAG: hypothetical protein HZA63_05650 [Rhodocyclales bacterium]|nr:hypothetical protein [Rhodocyclales bacterium]